MKAAVVGKDGRTSAIIEALQRSGQLTAPVRVLSAGSLGNTDESRARARAELLENAREFRPEFVVVGPEAPLVDGWVDLLRDELGIPCVGPTKSLAQLEASKSYTRRLLCDCNIPGNPEFRVFESIDGVQAYIESLGEFVIKPDGLTGGKGVKVSDVHLFSVGEGVEYCRELLRERDEPVVIEEKLDGEEFSLQTFSDGLNVAHMPLVQDHKRVGVGDTGPNTGGMGSYSCRNGKLPFVGDDDVAKARAINAAVLDAVRQKTGEYYKGILYGGFIATRDGVRLIEYNVRFGDPEALNVLSLLETDFVDLCRAVIDGRLASVALSFLPQSTVCKYLVPKGYPDQPVKNVEIDVRGMPPASGSLRIFEASVENRDGRKFLAGSRALAVVGIADELAEAETIAEQAAASVRGAVYHRPDIGTQSLISAKIDHMLRVRGGQLASATSKS